MRSGLEVDAEQKIIEYKDKCFYKKMAVIAIPISLQSMITIGVNMTDTVMVGKLGEADPLSDFTI